MRLRTLIVVGILLFSGMAAAAEPEVLPAEQGVRLPASVMNLLNYARNLEGALYKRGGNNPVSGFDCSGFVHYVFDRAEGVIIPHSSVALSKIGEYIRRRELHPGDLVFFSFMHSISHVGIYLGNDQFIHASSTQTGSVMVSSLNDGYWAKHFTLARRIPASAADAEKEALSQ